MPELQVTVTYATLDEPADMAAALAEALTRGWHGTITALKDEVAERWALVISTPANANPVSCRLGDILLWDGNGYQALDADTFAARYSGS